MIPTPQARLGSGDNKDNVKNKAQKQVNSLAVSTIWNLKAKHNHVTATASLALSLAVAKAVTSESTEEDMIVHEAMKFTSQLLSGKSDLTGNEVTVFHSVWVGSNLSLNKETKVLLGTYYSCEARLLPLAKTEINERKLKRKLHRLNMTGKFHEYIDATKFQNISNEDVLLTSAIHIAISWREPFPINSTTKSPFFISESVSIPVEMMSQKSGLVCAWCQVLRTTVVEVPLTANGLSVLFYLPYENNGLEFLESNLTDETFRQIMAEIGRTKPKPVNISIPKFSLLCNDKLSELTGPGSNFRKLANPATVPECHVFHTVCMTVNERGLNVPVHSGNEMIDTMIGPAVHDGIRWTMFTANHPFLLMLVDMRSKLVFVTGKVSAPEWSKEKKGNLIIQNDEKRNGLLCCI